VIDIPRTEIHSWNTYGSDDITATRETRICVSESVRSPVRPLCPSGEVLHGLTRCRGLCRDLLSAGLFKTSPAIPVEKGGQRYLRNCTRINR